MGELLAELTPRRMIVAVALVTTVTAGAVAARHGHHHRRHHHRDQVWSHVGCPGAPAMVQLPAPDDGNVIAADLDGDGRPEYITMTFAEHGDRFVTTLRVTDARGNTVPDVAGMSLVQPLRPSLCVAIADVWPARGAIPGRIELHERIETPHVDGPTTCEPNHTRIFVMDRGLTDGLMVDAAAASTSTRF